MTVTPLLAAKLLLVPALIGAVTLAGRRWGPAVAGWLSAFPVVSGPVLLFVAIEQGPAFASQAAAATVSAVLAMLVFGLVYARSALRFGWPVCAALAFAAWGLAVAAIDAWAPSLPLAAACVFVALLGAARAYPVPPRWGERLPGRAGGDLVWRLVAGAALVLLVTQFSARLGPRLSGLFAMFPVIGSVLAIFSHCDAGAGFAVSLLRGSLLGYYAFASFCAVLALALPRWPLPSAFAAALALALAVQGGVKLLQMRVARPVPTG